MKNQIFINLEHEFFLGNVLDIGFENFGIIYNLYKQQNDEIAIEYIEGKRESSLIEKGAYDSCILFFSLRHFWLPAQLKKFLKEISEYLKDGGNIYLWDIDKGYKQTFQSTIKVALPDKTVKEIEIKDYNILKNCGKEKVLALLKEYFDILDVKASDRIYYIKAQKKMVKVLNGL